MGCEIYELPTILFHCIFESTYYVEIITQHIHLSTAIRVLIC